MVEVGVIARTYAVVLFCAFAPVGCAHAVVDGIDDTSAVIADAGKDASPHLPKDAAPAKDTWQPQQPDAFVDEPDTSPVCSPKLSTGIAKCDTCEGQSCCAEDNACANDPQFSSLMNCYNACPLDGGFPDPTCMSGCDKKYQSGANNFNAWGNCMQTNCATSCR